jgi:hypothetical protein
LEFLVGVVRDETLSIRDRTAAACTILERGWGLPTSAHLLHVVKTEFNPAELSDAELVSMLLGVSSSPTSSPGVTIDLPSPVIAESSLADPRSPADLGPDFSTPGGFLGGGEKDG